MSTDTQTLTPILLSVTETARTLGISPRLLSKLNSSGQLPQPIRLGRRTLWAADELRDYVRAGCPSRERWRQMKEAQR